MLKFFKIFCDLAIQFQKDFQDPATPVMEGIIDLHHDIFFFLIIILFVVSWLLYVLIQVVPSKLNLNKVNGKGNRLFGKLYVDFKFKTERLHQYVIYPLNLSKNFIHNSIIEIIWTLIPSIILIFIAVPSFILLYSIDETFGPKITVKIIGHQWYWSYECYDILKNNMIITFNYDSYMINTSDLEFGEFRLLEVDAPLYLPIRIHIRLLITSIDVLHSWAMPSLGIKMDAVPGRLNQIMLYVKRSGTFYGQCSEICGINHGFMPIVLHAIPLKTFCYYFSKINI